jgi:hypothetical protein
VKSALSRFVDELHKTMARVFAYLVVLGATGFVGIAWLADLSAISRGDRSEQKSEWIETPRPQPAFAMTAGDFAASDPHYLIRRHPDGGGRKDVLTWGTAIGAERYLRIEIYRPGAEHDNAAEPDPDTVARLGEVALPGEAKTAGSLPTKLGAFSVVELGSDAQTNRRCLGAVRSFPELPLRIAGWHCDSAPAPAIRATIDCALDQLSLLTAGGDVRLAGLFARADQKRTFCGDKRPSLSIAPKPTDWLDVPVEPRLRGRFAMR